MLWLLLLVASAIALVMPAMGDTTLLAVAWVVLLAALATLLTLTTWSLFLRRISLTEDGRFVRLGRLGRQVPIERIEKVEAIEYHRGLIGIGVQPSLPDGLVVDSNLGDGRRAVRLRWRDEDDGALHRAARNACRHHVMMHVPYSTAS